MTRRLGMFVPNVSPVRQSRPPGSRMRRASERVAAMSFLREEVEDIGREKAVAAPVGTGQRQRARGLAHLGALAEAIQASLGQADHGRADVHAEVVRLRRKMTLEKHLGDPSGAASELEHASRLFESGMGDQIAQRRLLVERLAVLLCPETVVEGAGFVVAEGFQFVHLQALPSNV